MENAGYVAAGWVLTGASLIAYSTWVEWRARRAAKVLEHARAVPERWR